MLTISEQRYQEIRAGMKRKRWAARIEKIMAEPGPMASKNVDEFLAHLEKSGQPGDHPAKSLKKVR